MSSLHFLPVVQYAQKQPYPGTVALVGYWWLLVGYCGLLRGQ
nr:MAG TPA: hypothetical protein [Caudoviricetes sp.]